MSRFEIAFSGQVLAGAAPEQVKANLARLFQADEQRIALLFSGRRMVIKTDLDAAAAEKYRSALERAGALAEVRALDSETAPVPAASVVPEKTAAAPVTQTPVAASTVATGQSGEKFVPRDEYMAAFAEVEAPDFGIAPVGVDLQEQKAPVAAPQLDLSSISLAPVGSDMGELPRDAGGPAPDTSHLKVL